MSTTTINPTSETAVASATDRVQSELDRLTARLRRDVWLYGLLAVAATAVGLLLATVVSDAVFQPESTGLRFVLWIPVLAAITVATYRFVWCPLRNRCNRLALAWTLEEQRPELHEALTSTLLLAESNQTAAAPLVDAVAAQADRDLASCREDAATRRDIRRPAVAAASCVALAAFCLGMWSQYLLPSLSNVMAPWKTRKLPYLTAMISPGHIAVAEGEVLEVSASGQDLDDCVLEFMGGTEVLSSTPMTVTATGKSANALLTGLSTNETYRVRSGSLVSDVYQITVHPRPVVTDASATLQFPEYTGIPSAAVNDLSAPIAAIPGTRVKLSAATLTPISNTRLTFRDEQQGAAESVQTDGVWWHHWNLQIDEQPEQPGRLELISEFGVPSEPFFFEIQSVPDEPPTVSIKSPTLQHLTVAPDGELPIQFEATDDFGLHSVEVLMRPEDAEAQREMISRNLGATSHAAEYRFQPLEHDLKVGDQVTLWLVASDNRTQEYGGARTAESRQLVITITNDAASIGRQQVTEEQNRILESLSAAIDRLREAKETAKQISDATQQVDADGVPADTNLGAQKLQQQLQEAHQTLENATESSEDDAALFETERQQIRDIANEDVEEAKQQARMIPLTDDPNNQQRAAKAARSAIEQAEEKLAALQDQLNDRADKLQQAAELDELARQQNELARQMQEQKPAQQQQQQADPKQEKIADRLQDLVQNDPKAESEQFLQRADTAEQLAEKTTQLQEQQEQLTDAAELKTDKQMREQLVQIIKKEQEAIAAENQQLMEDAEQNEVDAANEEAVEAQQLMEQTANDLAEQNLKAAEQNAENAKRQLQEAATPKNAADDDTAEQQPQARKEKRDRLAERQERVEETIRDVQEDNFEAAADKLQKLITDRLQQVAEEAEELLELPTDDKENQQAGDQAQQELQEALKESKQASARPQGKQPKDAANSQPADAQPQQPAAAKQQEADPEAQQQEQPGQQEQKNAQPQAQNSSKQKEDAAAKQNDGGQKDAQPPQSKKAGQQEKKNGQPQAKSGEQKKDAAAKQNDAGKKDALPQKSAEAEQQKADAKAQQKPQPEQQEKENSQPRAQQANNQQPQTKPKDQQQRDSQKQKQKKAAESLKQATESLKTFCKSCRKCANCNKPGQSGSSSGNSSRSGDKRSGNKPSGEEQPGGKQSADKKTDDEQSGKKQSGGKEADNKPPRNKSATEKQSGEKQPGQSRQNTSGRSKQLAKTTDNAQKAARNPTPGAAKQLAKELDKLADDAAKNSDYPLRKGNKPEADSENNGPQQKQANAGKKGGKPDGKTSPTGEPMGVGRNSQPDDVGTTATQLRGPSTSEWTRSHKRLRGNVLDKKSTQIPEAYRGVVEDYFRQLSKIQSDEKKAEVSK